LHLKIPLWLRAVVVLLILIRVGPAGAEASSPKDTVDHYQEAMQALSEGRVEDARSELGVLIATEPEHPGAWLDLATLRCSLGDASEAERLFREIETRFDPPSGILEIISLQRARGCDGPKASSLGMVRVGRGYDSNANQGVSNPNFSIGSGSNRLDLVVLPAYQPISDQYTAVSAEYFRELPFLNDTMGYVQLRSRQYDKLSSFDTTFVQGGVERAWRLGDWRLRNGVTWGTTSLGSRTYLNQEQLQMQVTPPIKLPSGWQFLLGGGLTYSQYPTFQSYNGTVSELRGSLRRQTDKGLFQVTAGAMVDRQAYQRPGGDRKGYFASLDGRFLLSKGIIAELAWQHQQWQADTEYSPGLIDVRRQQNTNVARASLNVPIDQDNSILTEYQYTDNRENISLFQFRGHRIQMSWQYRFGK